VALEAIDDLADSANGARVLEEVSRLVREDGTAQDHASIHDVDLDRARMRHGTAQPCADSLLDDFVGDIARRRMADTLDEPVNALPRIARRLTEQLAFDPLCVAHRLLDAATAPSSADRIEQVHQTRAEEQAAGKTR
jgi:hypothetical protein